MKRLELVGKKFNRLTVLELSHVHRKKRSYWRCACECGNEITVTCGNLRSGHTKSCGCIRKENWRKKRLDLVGQKFGRLTVIERAHKDKWGKRFWRCLCECGNETVVISDNLRGGGTRSCGCLQKETRDKGRAANLTKRRLPKGEAACNMVVRGHKYGAKKRNIEQALTDEQIITIHKENCYYCNAAPSNVCSTPDFNGSYTYNGIDRLDNDIGYVLNNVVSCCYSCNMAKGKKSVEEFMEWIDNLITYRTNNQ